MNPSALSNFGNSTMAARLNPSANTFQPVTVQAGVIDNTNQSSITRIIELGDEPNLHAEVITLKNMIVEELCLIRRDLGLLMNGGWQLTIGPWQAQLPTAAAEHEVQAIQRRMTQALGGGGVSVAGIHEATSPRQAIANVSTTDITRVKTTITPDSSPSSSPAGPVVPKQGLAQSTATLPATTYTKGNFGHHDTIQYGPRPEHAHQAQESIKLEVQSFAAQRAKADAQQSDLVTVGTIGAQKGSSNKFVPPHLKVQVAKQIAKQIPERDVPKPSTEDCAIPVSTSNWMPRAVRDLKPIANLSKLPTLVELTPFSWDFLTKLLRGIEHSPGMFYSPKSTGMSVLAGRTYYLIDRTHEPYVPKLPGLHGAKLTVFFNNTPTADGEDPWYDNVPLFVTENGKDYYYFGQYSQKRWSDKLDYDRMSECVPDAVKMYHAELLADPARPTWVTEQLMKHFWPKPEYDGVVPKSSIFGTPAIGSATQPTMQTFANGLDGGFAGTGHAEKEDKSIRKAKKHLDQYMGSLRAWEKEARMKVGLIKKETILEAFEEADAADPPGLRLWWEYLQCMGFDSAFYNTIAKLQLKERSGNRYE